MNQDKLTSPLGPLPDGWRLVNLSDVATKIGSTPRGGEGVYLPTRQNFALIRSQNVHDRRFDSSDLAFISDEHAQEMQGVALKPGDVLLNITGDGVTFARSCVVPPDVLPACVNQHVTIIRPEPSLCSAEYLNSYLTHPVIKSYIESFNAGGSRRAVTKGHIQSFVLPLPPLSEQVGIGYILKSFDDKIELNRRLNGTLEAMARAFFKSWFVDFNPVGVNRGFPGALVDSAIGLIPAGWQVGVLRDFAEYILGGAWGADEGLEEEALPVLCIRGADIPSLQSAGVGKMPVRYMKESILERRRLRNGDLVIEVSGGSPTQSTGRPILMTQSLLSRFSLPLVCSNFCRMLRPSKAAASKFIYLLLDRLYWTNQFLPFENGTTGIKNLDFARFCETYKFVVPSLGLLEAFDEIVGPLFEWQQRNGRESDTLANIRDALLPKLLSGEIRIKKAEEIVEEAI